MNNSSLRKNNNARDRTITHTITHATELFAITEMIYATKQLCVDRTINVFITLEIADVIISFVNELTLLKSLSRDLRRILGVKVTALSFHEGTPAAIIRSVVSKQSLVNVSIKKMCFTKCLELTNELLNEIVAVLEVKEFVLTRCDGITRKPLGAQVMFGKHNDTDTSIPRIVTPGCWICYEPHDCVFMDPESIVEIMLNALHYGSEAYENFSRMKFSIFCIGAYREMLESLETHGLKNIWFHEIITHAIRGRTAYVEAKVNDSLVFFSLRKPEAGTILWKVLHLHM